MSSSDEIKGELQIGLIYDASAGILTVRLVEVIHLFPYLDICTYIFLYFSK